MKKGDKVHYVPFLGANKSQYQNGIVKAVNEHDKTTLFVVFNCGGEWDKYEDYTGQSVKINDLRNGWLVEEEQKSGYIDEEILQAAIDTWGIDSQKEMIIEECMELVLALQKLKRTRGNPNEKIWNVIDEIADVKIMILQAQRIFPSDLINERVDFKMTRLKERLIEKIE